MKRPGVLVHAFRSQPAVRMANLTASRIEVVEGRVRTKYKREDNDTFTAPRR